MGGERWTHEEDEGVLKVIVISRDGTDRLALQCEAWLMTFKASYKGFKL